MKRASTFAIFHPARSYLTGSTAGEARAYLRDLQAHALQTDGSTVG